MKGLPYGGAAPIQKPTPKPPPKKPTNLGFVAAVSGLNQDGSHAFEMHKESWVGAVNLQEDFFKQLRQMFKCVQCRTNDHTLPSCPLMKSWITKKKVRNDDSSSCPVGGVNSVLASTSSDTLVLDTPQNLTPILEDDENYNDDDDHYGSVEFDLLESNSLDVMTISSNVSPYSNLKVPMSSVCSIASSQVCNECLPPPFSGNFNLIVDSRCTRHMFPFKRAFISYKPTPNSYVILADKSKVACMGFGTTSFVLDNKTIILHNVLHVPKLRSPLLSVRCFRHLLGCSFLADNKGSFLTFPKFILPVDDSSYCTISGSLMDITTEAHFDSRLAGSICAVSDNTRFKQQCRPVSTATKKTSSITELHPNLSSHRYHPLQHCYI